MKLCAASIPPSRYTAPIKLSKTSAIIDEGVWSCEPIPLPMTRNSSIPNPSEILAQVRRETTIDLIRVRSPSR